MPPEQLPPETRRKLLRLLDPRTTDETLAGHAGLAELALAASSPALTHTAEAGATAACLTGALLLRQEAGGGEAPKHAGDLVDR